MAANRRFAAGDFGGKCERGLPPFTINNNRIGTRRRAPKVHKGVSIPEPGAAGSRVPRPQPLLLRGLRAALAALRKPGAKRRAVSGRGPKATKTHGSDQHSTMAPSGDRSTYAMESVKGGYPLSQSVTTNRNSPKRAPAREGVSIAGAKRRGDPGRGPYAIRTGGPDVFQCMAPSGVLSDFIPGAKRRGDRQGGVPHQPNQRSNAIPVRRPPAGPLGLRASGRGSISSGYVPDCS